MKKTKKYSKKEGLKHYRKKQFTRAISCFEKALKENKNDHEIFLYLGYASVFTDDLEGALKYFRHGLLIAEDNIDLLKGLAFSYLKNERVEDAINKWGEILEKKPGDRFARKAIERLRASDNIDYFVENARPKDFFSGKLPLSEKIKPYIMGLSITFGIIVICVIFYTTPLYKKVIQKYYPELSTLNKISFPETGPVIRDDSEDALYSFSEKEIETNFLKVKKSIHKNDINNAIILLNKVMLSNASPLVKEKFEILYKFIDPPDPLSIDYNPYFYEILKEPAAFKGVYVLWTGRIANLELDKKNVQFDLLVNYENEDTIDGIAHVTIYGTYYIENRQKVEVYGFFDGYDTESGKLLIDGIFIRDLKIQETAP